MKKILGLVGLIAIASLLLAACGADEEETTTAQPTSAPSQPTSAPVSTTAPAEPTATAELGATGQALTAPEAILKAAQEMGVPLQLPQPPAQYKPVKGGHLDLVTNGWPFPRYWDWPVRGGYSNMYISLFAETLMTFPQGPGTNPADYSPQGLLAKSWEITDGGLTYTFKLQDGVHFNSDKVDVDTSREVGAQDWVDLAAISFGVEGSRYFARMPEIAGPESWVALDDKTLQIKVDHPVASFLYKLAIRGPQLYGTKGIYDRVEAEGVDLQEAMKSPDVQVGTGPWILTEWTPDLSVKYKANSVYWGKDQEGSQLPFIDTVEMFVMKDERAQDAGFRTGKLGAIALETCGMSTERYEDINTSNPDTVWEIFVDPTNQRAVYMNYMEGTPWHDQRVRQAVQLAIDKDGWVESVLGGWGLPFSTPLAPNDWWLPPGQYGDYDGDGVPGERMLDYDPEAAKALLAEAGFSEGITGTFMLTHDLGNRFFSEGELIVESLRKIGIDLEIDVKDGAEREAAWEAGDYTLSFGFPGYGWDPADWLFRGYHTSNTLNSQPKAGLNDPALDKMIDAEEGEVSPAKRYELVADIQRYLMEKQYHAMSTNWIQIVAIAPWLKNYQYQYSYPIGPNLKLAWVER